MNRTARWSVLAAGLAALVVLFLVLRPAGDDDRSGGAAATSAASPAPTERTTPAPTVSPTPEVRTIEVEFAGGDVQGPERVEVARGERIRIEVSADVSDEVHVHGYDLTAEVTPAAPAVIELVADVSGVFEVELEERHVLLFRLEVGA